MEVSFKGKEFNIAEAFEKAGKSKNTVYTYTSMIRKALKLLNDNKIDTFVDNPQEVINTIKELPNNNTGKTILSAIVILLDSIDKPTADVYRDVMMEKIKIHEDEQDQQKLSEKQEKNWITWEQVLDTYNKSEKIAKTLLSSNNNLNTKELQIVQNWVILSLYTKIPPRRILDYVLLRWEPSENGENAENYIDMKKKKLIFNVYKTANKYGKEEVDIPKDLIKVIKKWKSVVPENIDFVLFNGLGKELSQSELTTKINKIFGKNISASMLRHIYLSNVYKDVPKLTEMKDRAKDMGHSLDQALKYVKKI